MRVHYITDKGRNPQIGDLIVDSHGNVMQYASTCPQLRRVDPELAEEARKAVVMSLGGVSPLRRFVKWGEWKGDKIEGAVGGECLYTVAREWNEELGRYTYWLPIFSISPTLPVSAGAWEGLLTNCFTGTFEAFRLLIEADFAHWLKEANDGK